MLELAYRTDLKSVARKGLRVRLPSWAPLKETKVTEIKKRKREIEEVGIAIWLVSMLICNIGILITNIVMMNQK